MVLCAASLSHTILCILAFKKKITHRVIEHSHLRAERGQVWASRSGTAEGRAHISHRVGQCNAPGIFQMTAEGQRSKEKQ